MTERLVGPGEIAQLLGVRRGTVVQWRHRGLMPEPVGTVSAGGFAKGGIPVWRWTDVEAWAKQTGRLQ